MSLREHTDTRGIVHAMRTGRVVGAEAIDEHGRAARDLYFRDGRFSADHRDGDAIDATGLVAVPGFIDLQVNGGWGHDFTNDPDSIWSVGERLLGHGVTSFLPTIVSAPYEVAEAAIDVVSRGPPAGYGGARVLGLHIEGPWISPDWAGAHDREELVLPDTGVAVDWVRSGVVAMVTIAPELPGAYETARRLAQGGVVVSAGHTGATYDEAMAAFAGPWGSATHLYNQMSPLHHRDPGVVGAVLDVGVPAGLIADGLHCHPAAARLALERLGPGSLFLVSDAMAATGQDAGLYRLGDATVEVGDEGPRTADGRLAGSVLTLDRAVSNLGAWLESSLQRVIPCATSAPAGLLGREDLGTLATGSTGDLVLLSSELAVVATFVDGVLVHHAQSSGKV